MTTLDEIEAAANEEMRTHNVLPYPSYRRPQVIIQLTATVRALVKTLLHLNTKAKNGTLLQTEVIHEIDAALQKLKKWGV